MASASDNLTGKLLLAHPTLRDPNFRHSIVYLSSHDTVSGAFGFIINRPITQSIDDLQVGDMPSALLKMRLHLGSPVGTDRIFFATAKEDILSGKIDFEHSLELPDSEYADPRDTERTLALIGYAGWTDGQLEQEISGNSWLIQTTNAVQADLLHADDHTWKTLVSRIHPHLKLLAECPEKPDLN